MCVLLGCNTSKLYNCDTFAKRKQLFPIWKVLFTLFSFCILCHHWLVSLNEMLTGLDRCIPRRMSLVNTCHEWHNSCISIHIHKENNASSTFKTFLLFTITSSIIIIGVSCNYAMQRALPSVVCPPLHQVSQVDNKSIESLSLDNCSGSPGPPLLSRSWPRSQYELLLEYEEQMHLFERILILDNWGVSKHTDDHNRNDLPSRTKRDHPVLAPWLILGTRSVRDAPLLRSSVLMLEQNWMMHSMETFEEACWTFQHQVGTQRECFLWIW